MVDDMEGLAAKSCIPCRGGVPPLTPDAADESSPEPSRLEPEENATRLVRRFEFRDFVEAMSS